MKWTSDHNWLNIAEYVSLSSSFAGLIVALTSQQLVYAAAPLTLAMSLNFANRQRFQQQVRQQKATISKVCQETQLLNNKVLSLPSANQVNVLEVSINHLEQAIVDIDTKQQINSLIKAFNNRPELKEVDDLKESISLLHDRIINLPSFTAPFEPSHLTAQMENLTERLENLPLATLQQEVVEVQELVRSLDASAAELHDRTRNLAQMQQNLDTVQETTCSLNQRTTLLENRIDTFELSIKQHLDSLQQLTIGYIKADDFERLRAKLSQELTEQIEATVEQRVAEINYFLKEIQPKYEYKLVCDRDQSRSFLLKAAKEAKERLILVCPWLHWGIRWNDGELLNLFYKLLGKPNSSIEIGWGHYLDMENKQVRSSSTSLRQSLKTHGKMYTALPQLEKLEKDYPQQFKLKLLGTHEKFLVCDRAWAMLGSHNFLSSGDKSQEREVGLWTNDPYIVNELTKRFEKAKDLEHQHVHLAVAS
ncbi:phospholipase D-like domain-containing protein [Chlorogloea sp. CCALA 695]|uniref:phospholipase D-like domain-containing protein n=1 Tax=Chlorogloea sp. CCALA 695 TaxID=2107693 RepID=UPI000D05E65E|nr:phospholipase D-like domain-containing protein [Chlorogloea sp. CCALA 695]PSB30487.1 hypothetical protein C7B70_16165 [Chlorogloea sp. CCALA 695]